MFFLTGIRDNAARYSSVKDIEQTVATSHYFKTFLPPNIDIRLDTTFVHQMSRKWPYLDTAQK